MRYGAHHSFDIDLATELKSIELAVLVQHFQFWIRHNAKMKRNFHDKRTWTYQTLKDIAAYFPYWSEKQVRLMINKLVEAKILMKGNYNKSAYDHTIWYAFRDEERFIIYPVENEPSPENCPNGQIDAPERADRTAQMGRPIPDTIPYTLPNTTTPPTPPLPAAPDAACAASGGAVEISKTKLKKVKEPVEFSKQVREVADTMIAIIKKAHPVYRLPDKLEGFLSAVQQMIEIDKQNPALILKAFEWACNDTVQRENFKGWQGIVCSNKKRRKPSNPAEIFHEHFSTIYSQMKSRPERKFAPGSDDEAAIQIMQDMQSRAL